MAGKFPWSERSLVHLANANGASLTNLSGAAASTADLDARYTAGAGNAQGDDSAAFRLTCQWGTVTAIAAGTIVADLYLVPKIDGSTLPQVDLTAGSSYISPEHYAGSFTAAKIPTATTNTVFDCPDATLQPLLYTAHIINRSGQTISANWSLDVVTAQHQYT